MIKVAGVIVRQGKAYVPVHAEIEGGPYLIVEPVFKVNLTVSEVVKALEQAIAIGHPQIPTPTKEEMQQRKDLILTATGVKTWNQLAKGGADYSMCWEENQITLYMSRLDKKGRFEADPAKTKTFAKDTPLPTIVEAILADVQTRPELDLAVSSSARKAPNP